jgi:SAM-dependent methyltransferase
VTRTDEVYSRYSRDPRKQRAWAAGNPGNVALREELLVAILELAEPQLRGSGRVLDIGCGTGWLLSALIDAGVEPGRLTGVESQPARVEAARSRAPGAQVVEGDALGLDLADGEFSLVLLLTVLSSLGSAVQVRAALREAGRVLAPSGLLLVYEPRVPNPFNRNTRLLRDADLRAAGLGTFEARSLTVLPPLARRLGGPERAPGRYARFARIPMLRTHRLIVHRGS